MGFKEKYKDELELHEYYFKHEKQKKKDRVDSSLNLFIKSKIISNSMNKTIEINLKHKVMSSPSENYQNTWIYDKRMKGDISYWIASEAEEVII